MGSPPTPYWRMVKGSRDLLLEFWNPFHISETVWARNLKFGSILIAGCTNNKNEKLGQRGFGRGHVTYFWNFGTPSISGERFELESSNLACRLITGGLYLYLYLYLRGGQHAVQRWGHNQVRPNAQPRDNRKVIWISLRLLQTLKECVVELVEVL